MSEIQSGANNIFQRARKLQREGRLEKAIAIFQEAIEKNPNFAWYYHDLGEVLDKDGKLDDAIIQLCKAIEIKPGFVAAYEKLKNILLKQGYKTDAINALICHMKKTCSKSFFLPTLSYDINNKKGKSKLIKNTKVFGIGLGKTGTKTLEACFKTLGYENFDWYTVNRYRLIKQTHIDSYSDTFNIVDSYESFRDYPWPFIYKELCTKYPDSKFILTTRKDEDTWYESLVKHFDRGKRMSIWYDIIYKKSDISCKEYFTNFYNNHNQQVIDYFADKPDKLLVICWENKDGWNKLCDFLNKSVPKVPFPHLNKS